MNKRLKNLQISGVGDSELCPMSNKHSSNTFVSLKEVAAYLGMTENYSYELVHQRKIQFYKPFGKKLMFNLDEVKATIEGSKVESKASYSEIDAAANNLMLSRGRTNG